jgi:serine/threonine protein kinase
MSDSSSGREPLEELAESFLARFRAGERPSLTDVAAAHPDLADQIRELFPALIEMEQVGSATGSAPPGAAIEEMRSNLGDYRILREVGRGGMGVVYEAVQESLGRHVALKVFAPWSRADARQIERFRREARAAARLHHTNIVPVFGVGEDDGVRYYAMQFIRGQGLDAILEELRRLRSAPQADEPGAIPGDSTPPVPLAATVARSLETGRFHAPAREAEVADRSEIGSELSDTPTAGDQPASDASHWAGQAGGSYARTVARVGLQVADALAHAHAQGVVHRDIKPSNLLLDVAGNIWVSDFGLAKSDDADALTEPGDIVGTVRYMAPERFRGDSGPKGDVYGLGATLYELLTLRPAFDRRDRARLIDQILHEDPPPPRSVDRRIPRDLETIALKAMAKHPADRYASARALADDLGRFLDDRTIRARRWSLTERLWRWCRRNPMVAALEALAATLLIAIAIISAVAAIWLGQSRGKVLANLSRARTAEANALVEAANARRSAAESEAVRRFLENDLLAAGRPEGQDGGLSKDATIRQAVDAARLRIGGAFKDQPVIEAAVRHTLGTTYDYLGEPELAIRDLERAVALRRDHLGADHPDTLQSRDRLAVTYRTAGRIRDAIALHQATLKVRESTLGLHHPDTLQSRGNLASAYEAAGQAARAISIWDKMLPAARTVFGPGHPNTLTICGALASARESLGRWAQAEPLRCELLARRRETAEPLSPVLAGDLAALARNLMRQAKWSEAESLLRECLAIREKTLPDDCSRFNVMGKLGVSLAMQGKFTQGEPLVIGGYEGLKARDRKLPHRRCDTCLFTAAELIVRMYEAWDKPDQARAWALKLGLADLPPDVLAPR